MDPSENWYNASARGYLEYLEGAGNRMINWKDRGYSTILDILMVKHSLTYEFAKIMMHNVFQSWRDR